MLAAQGLGRRFVHGHDLAGMVDGQARGFAGALPRQLGRDGLALTDQDQLDIGFMLQGGQRGTVTLGP